MNPIERALSILLLLGRRRLLPATDLAGRFEVSVRTIYRDIDRLIGLGVPVEAERGASGGFRLSAEFLAPPIALNRVETTAILVALALMRGLRATPLKKRPRSGGGEAARGAAAGGARHPRQGLALRRHRAGARRHFSPRALRRAAGRSARRRRPLPGGNPDAAARRARRTAAPAAPTRFTTWSRTACSSIAISGISSAARSPPTTSACGAPTASFSATVTGMAFRPQRGFRHPHDARPPMAGTSHADLGQGARRGRASASAPAAAERLKRDWYFRHATFAKAGDAVLMTHPRHRRRHHPAARALARRGGGTPVAAGAPR